ncbi:hypothetical protein M011DRAFT_448070 [Sporormia fimetaria CBS 119925]|uniref:Uncharacterized protein n=1 Tax=Sporormia fimetaria CBS 119925 TaxID=1340428 RepID=A0A6A6V3U9_9PLEO|nr:hypothetical protein M011DRAFT_448070 [Sporormia fimetaria CBS 119925]
MTISNASPTHARDSSPPLDLTSHPSTFQTHWKHHADPTALPFPASSPPFPLTPIDWQQLSLTDSQFRAHTWSSLSTLIASSALDELKRWPSDLKAYLAWTAHVKAKYGSSTNYLLQQRLHWTPLPRSDGVLEFETKGARAFEEEGDWKVLRNDWGYAVEEGVVHLCVWSKVRLEVDGEGALTEKGKEVVEGFVRREFRERVGEKEKGEMVLWFRNPMGLQSVRSLEHVHVLLRGVEEGVVRRWLN